MSSMCWKWESAIHVMNVVVKEINKLQKISVTIPKGVDDGTRIRLAGKEEKRELEEQVEIYIYLLMLIAMNFLKIRCKFIL